MADNIKVTIDSASSTSIETKEVTSGIHRQVITGGIAHGADDAYVHLPVMRQLDLNGDGTGTREHAADYSTADEAYIEPSGSTNLFCKRLIIAMADGAPTTGGFAGLGSSLSNGILIRVLEGASTIFDITGGDAITDTEGFLRVATEFRSGQFGTGLWWMHAVIDFEQLLGHLLKLDGGLNQQLSVRLQDDLSGLDTLRFMFYGLRESAPS